MSETMKQQMEFIHRAVKELLDFIDQCPKCKVSLIGEAIPKEHRHHFGNQTHFSRKIGIVVNDRVRTWQCPECGHKWPREN